jgi:hypothetical protein
MGFSLVVPVIDQRVHSCRRCRGKKDATSVRLLPSVKTRPLVATTDKHGTAEMAHSVDLEEQIRSGENRIREIVVSVVPAPEPQSAPPDPIPRISRLMALAIHFDGLIRDGVVKNYADLARLGGVSRARITQIMNLLNLPPWKQEELLFLEGGQGRAQVTERDLRMWRPHSTKIP